MFNLNATAMDIWWIKNMLERGLQRYDVSIEDDGDKIYVYVYGYDNLSERHQYNIDSEIESICKDHGLCFDFQNGDPCCWTIED